VIAERPAPPPEEPSPGGDRPGVLASSLWRAVMAFCRVVVPSGFVLLALIGALVTPPVAMLVVAPLIGCVTGVMVVLLSPAVSAEPWGRRAALYTAATGAAFVPFTSGVALFGSAGGVLALVLLVLGSCLAADGIADVIEDMPAGGALPDDHWLVVVMPSLPTAALLQQWRATRAVSFAGRGAAEQARAAHVRGLILDELARRDPAAVERWLTSGDWSSGPRIRPDRGMAG
jgi:hypothetical protein